MEQPPQKPPVKWTATAIMLFVIGLLILIPSGLCTGVFGIGMLVDAAGSGGGDAVGVLMMVLTIGGIPIAIGAALVYAGLKARKEE